MSSTLEGRGSHLTPIQLCEAIMGLFEYLPPAYVEETRRVYELTFTLVRLYVLGLAVPTKSAHARLRDLYDVMDRERERRIVEMHSISK